MPKLIEVDEQEYAQKKSVFDTLAKIAKNPAAAKLLEQAHKAAEPTVSTPLLDAEAKQNEPLLALQKKFDDYVAKVEKDRTEADVNNKQLAFQAQWNAGQAKLKARGYTDEAIKKFEADMTERGISDHELYADAWEKRNPPPPPAPPSTFGGAWNFAEAPEGEDPGAKFVKDLITTQGKQDYVSDKAARIALDEFRQAQRGR